MFPLRLGLHVVMLVIIGTRSCSADSLDQVNLDGLNHCCKIGLQLDACTEKRINQTSHIAPSGICRTAIELCCTLNPETLRCDVDFIVNSYDLYCEKAAQPTCCQACKLGREIASAGGNLTERITFLHNNPVDDVMVACYDHKIRNNRDVEKFLPTKAVGLGYFYNKRAGKWQDVNECEVANNGCHENQDCVNTQGSYSCIPRSICADDYEFDYVELVCKKKQRCTDVVYLTIKEDDSDAIPGQLTDSVNMESTVLNLTVRPPACGQGYYRNWHNNSCEDIDECSLNQKICEQICVNFVGGFKCQCRQGYQVDPRKLSSCIDIDECRENDPCSHSCRNVEGSFRCLCPKGFSLRSDERTCVDINECSTKPKICGNQTCINKYGSYICKPKCPEGYTSINYGNFNIRKCMRNRCSAPFSSSCLDNPIHLTYKNMNVRTSIAPKNRYILYKMQHAEYDFRPSFDFKLSPKDCIAARNLRFVEKNNTTIVALKGFQPTHNMSNQGANYMCEILISVKNSNRIFERIMITLTFNN